MCGTCGCGHNEGPVITMITNETSHHETKDHHHHHHDHPDHDHHHHHHHHENGHGHDHHHTSVMELEQDILQKNQLLAERNRGYFMAKDILTFNLVSSPGSGKTTLLEKTLQLINKDLSCYVIEGDQQTTNDAIRIKSTGTEVVQVNTGKGCHLESDMVQNAVKQLKPADGSVLFIENVGNLVCPSMFDLGEQFRVVIMSVTEGDDKPIKYPDAFHASHVCVINKIDLLPYVQFDIEKAKDHARKVNPHIRFFEVSATQGQGMDNWIQWIKEQRKS